MRYRWFNVKVEQDDDGEVSVLFEGRGEFPFGERIDLEEGDSLTIHGEIDIGDSLADQPENVEWYMKNVAENEIVARGPDNND